MTLHTCPFPPCTWTETTPYATVPPEVLEMLDSSATTHRELHMDEHSSADWADALAGVQDRAAVTVLAEPFERSDRGFLGYGGPIPTDYGHDVQVYESSAAKGPCVWLAVGDSALTPGHNAHLTLAQALKVRAALDQFMEGVADRWEGGADLVAEARREVFGGAE